MPRTPSVRPASISRTQAPADLDGLEPAAERLGEGSLHEPLEPALEPLQSHRRDVIRLRPCSSARPACDARESWPTGNRCLHSREWRNWQTRRIQVPVPARVWGFKSPLAHPSSRVLAWPERRPGGSGVCGSSATRVRPRCPACPVRGPRPSVCPRHERGRRAARDRARRHASRSLRMLSRTLAGGRGARLSCRLHRGLASVPDTRRWYMLPASGASGVVAPGGGHDPGEGLMSGSGSHRTCVSSLRSSPACSSPRPPSPARPPRRLTRKKPSAAGPSPTLLFVADGMRQDLIERVPRRGGDLPGFARLLQQGAEADGNGLLTQAPPNTGAGWFTLATGAWPGVHGSTNNTFHINGQPFGELDERVRQPGRAPGRDDRAVGRARGQEGRADRVGRWPRDASRTARRSTSRPSPPAAASRRTTSSPS